MNVSQIAQMVFDLMDQGTTKERSVVEPNSNPPVTDAVELTHYNTAGTPDDVALVSSLGLVTFAQAPTPSASASAPSAPADSAPAPQDSQKE